MQYFRENEQKLPLFADSSWQFCLLSYLLTVDLEFPSGSPILFKNCLQAIYILWAFPSSFPVAF
jgi:hypothetical protein